MDTELEDIAGNIDRRSSFAASIRAGIRDLRDYPSIVSMTVVTVMLGTAIALLGPLFSGAAEVGEAYVTMNSEILVLAEPDLRGNLTELSTDLARIEGVSRIREATPSDFEALSPSQLFTFHDGDALVIEPNGSVPVQSIHRSALHVPGVASAAFGVGVPSQLAIELAETLIPWLAVASLAAAILLVVVLSVMTARSRAGEAVAMRLVGGSTASIWIRIGLVVAVPTFLVVNLTTVVIAIAAPSIASRVLPVGVTMVGAAHTVLTTGLLLGGAALLVAGVAGLTALWRAAT